MPDIKQTFFRFFGFFGAIRDINEKYKEPRIKMTPLVRGSLIFLRLYLIFMVVVILYKFISTAFFGR